MKNESTTLKDVIDFIRNCDIDEAIEIGITLREKAVHEQGK